MDKEIIQSFLEEEKLEKLNNELVFNINFEHYCLENTTIFDLFNILLPDKFGILDFESAKQKYPSEFRPEAIFSSEDTTINFCFNKLEKNDYSVEERLNSFRSIIKKTNPSTLVLENTIDEENNCGYFSFRTEGLDGGIFILEYIKYFSDSPILMSFNCPWKFKDQWSSVLKLVRESIKEIS